MKITFFTALFLITVSLQIKASQTVDFIEYVAELTPNLQKQSLKGKVNIKFRLLPGTARAKQQPLTLEFSSTDMQINSVGGEWLLKHEVLDNRLYVELDGNRVEPNTLSSIEVEYSAAPKLGMVFGKDYIYSRYHTQNWMVSHDAIGDTAKFDLTLHLPPDMLNVANGELVSKKRGSKLVSYRWRESRPRPIFTFGFAAGNFKETVIEQGNRQIHVFYLSSTEKEIEKIFADIGKASDFFAKVSGQTLLRKRYTFVVTEEDSMQEASGFSLVGRKYLHHVLKEPRESSLASHELAHEWWGNAISASSWNDFWLNEGLVQFMVAAFKEKVYGRDELKKMVFYQQYLRLSA